MNIKFIEFPMNIEYKGVIEAREVTSVVAKRSKKEASRKGFDCADTYLKEDMTSVCMILLSRRKMMLQFGSLVISRPRSWSSRSLEFGLRKSCSWSRDLCQKSWPGSRDLLPRSWLGLGLAAKVLASNFQDQDLKTKLFSS